MAVGSGFQDVELQMRYGEAASQRARLRQLDQYQRQMDQRRMQREDESYARTRRVDRQERLREQMGAELAGAMMQGGTKEELYERVQTIIKKKRYRKTDPAGTDAGRGMFGAYGILGRRSIEAAGRPLPGAMTPAEELEAKYTKAKAAALNAGDEESEEFWDRKLAEVKQGTIPLTEAELKGGMSDMVAASKAAGGKIREAAVIEPADKTTKFEGDYDYAAAQAAGAKPDEQGHWPSEFKKDTHPNLIVDGLNTKTADINQVIDVYTKMAVRQLGPKATREQIIALAKKLAKDKGWKIDG